MLLVKVLLITLGSLALMFGLVKTWWEVKSWEVLSQLGERPPLVGNDPRVHVKLYVAAAALGLTLFCLGVIL